MNIRKNEITTGLLVLITLGILVAALIFLGLPGVIKPLNTFRIYYDNAKGIRPGAPVMLAGREIGKVKSLESPVPANKRPAGHPDYEVAIVVRVNKTAKIYNDTTVQLAQDGLMGQMLIDFVKGDENSGLAENHKEFTGRRVPDLSESVSGQIERLTGPGSDLAETIRNVKGLMEKVNQPEVTDIIKNAKNVTVSVQEVIDKINKPELSGIVRNTEEMTDTLKREPWRLLWPSTKKYGDEKDDAAKAERDISPPQTNMEDTLLLRNSKIGTKR